MITAQVNFIVKTNETEHFIELTKINVSNSLKEPGVKRFEFYKDTEVHNSFYLFEIYYSKEDQQTHRETEHYKFWKQNISGLLVQSYTIKQLEII